MVLAKKSNLIVTRRIHRPMSSQHGEDTQMAFILDLVAAAAIVLGLVAVFGDIVAILESLLTWSSQSLF
jgi:hypothetical protein